LTCVEPLHGDLLVACSHLRIKTSNHCTS
jgi:hypothetical protein